MGRRTQKREIKALQAVSFDVKAGEAMGLIGGNGAGKSTTMKMITGYLSPDAGDIRVNGVDVVKDPMSAKKKIGYLPESNALYYDLYVREYLGFVAEVHGIANKNQRVEEVIELTGLSLESKKQIGQLSKGYKQRTGLAAALLHNPDVLILDEPTSGLDPNQIIEIRNVIKDQGKNKLVLFSSHILQEVEAICDRVIIINKGKIVADDKLANLQRSSDSNIVKVAFKEPLEPEWMRRIQGVRSVNKLDNFTWALQTSEPDVVRKQLFEMALQQNLNIVSLHNENQSLEEVFRSLTQSTPTSTSTNSIHNQ